MVECARCGRDVNEVYSITPDLITNELVDEMDHGETDIAGEGDMEVCADCMDELKGE